MVVQPAGKDSRCLLPCGAETLKNGPEGGIELGKGLQHRLAAGLVAQRVVDAKGRGVNGALTQVAPVAGGIARLEHEERVVGPLESPRLRIAARCNIARSACGGATLLRPCETVDFSC